MGWAIRASRRIPARVSRPPGSECERRVQRPRSVRRTDNCSKIVRAGFVEAATGGGRCSPGFAVPRSSATPPPDVGNNRSVELHFITAHPDRRPEDAVRFLLDTNVAAPFLRWMAAGARPPEADVVDAFRWLQTRCRTANVASALEGPRDLAVEMRWAAIETSRRTGEIDGRRLAHLDAAQALLCDWLASAVPIQQRLNAGPPTLRSRRQVERALDGASTDTYHLEVMVCLVRLAKLHHRRRAGGLTRPSDRLDALESWVEDVRPVGAMSTFLFLAAVQTALGGDGAPARSMCKFSQYRDRETAVKASSNASWDMLFLRMMQASEVGLTPYLTLNGPTTLLTFDRQFARSAKGVIGAFLGVAVNGSQLPGSVGRLRQHLQRDVSNDPRMLARLDELALQVRAEQEVRMSGPYEATYADVQHLLEEALDDLF